MKRFFAILFVAAVLAGCSQDNDTQQYDYFTFEKVDAKYLAGPTSYGENLYADYAGDQYTGYSDAPTGLTMQINTDDAMEWNLWSGGIAISRWNYMEDTGSVIAQSPANQCSVYFKGLTGNGGHNCSKTFGVVYCATYGDPDAPALYFADGTERVFDHFWVTNSTHVALTMENGDRYSKDLNYDDEDFFLLTIEGYDKTGASTGTVECYLADFRTAKSGGIVKKWTKVDLSTLGSVNRLEFVLSGSDSGQFGLNTPGYFCFDDVAIRR